MMTLMISTLPEAYVSLLRSPSTIHRSAQSLPTVPTGSLRNPRGARLQVKSVKGTGIQMEFNGYTGSRQTPSIVHILFEKEIKGTD
jgi:hypothetical protein